MVLFQGAPRDVVGDKDHLLLFPVDPDAPSVGTWRHWGKIFWARKKRVVGQDPSERLHPTAAGRSPRADEFKDAAVLEA